MELEKIGQIFSSSPWCIGKIVFFFPLRKTFNISLFIFWKHFVHDERQGKVAHEPRRPTRPERIPVSVAWDNWEYCYFPLEGMLVHRRVTSSSMSPVPIYTPGWREIMWGKVSCLRKQHDDRDWASNHRPFDLKSNPLTTTPPHPPRMTNGT